MNTTDNVWNLLTRKIAKQISREENDELHELLKHDSSLHKASEIVDNTWTSLDNRVIETSMNGAWKKIATGIQKNKKQQRIRRMWRYAAAACITVMLIGGFFANSWLEKPEMLVAINEGNQAQMIMLPDSSEVWLGSGARLEYPKNLATRKREVTLKGEAFFHVRKDNGRKFRVITDLVQITVLGTRFDVKTNETKQLTEVILESGSVKLTKQGDAAKEVILKPGEMGTVKKQQGIDVCNVDVHLYTAWKDDYLTIESLMLADVMFMLSQRYHTSILLEGDHLKKEIFSGRFDKEQSLEDILNTISLLIPLQYEKQADNTYVITSK